MSSPSDKLRADYTEGSIIRSILGMGIPSMFGFISQNIYSLADIFWVARLPEGESGVAAITFFGTILWMFFSFNQLVGPGSVAVISRRYGEKKLAHAETAIKETLILKLFFGFLFGIIGYLYVPQMLKLLGAKGDALTMGVEYGQIMFVGMGFMYATFSIYTAMRGVADPKMAMVLMVGSNILNIILDPLLIFGYLGFPAMGINGAAIASVIAYTVTLIIGLILFYGKWTTVRLTLRGEVPIRLSSMWHIMKIGIPAWVGSMSFAGARLLITPMIASFGMPVVAAYGVGNQITHFGIMLLVGIGLGLSALIGHNLGGGKIERAKKTADQAIYLSVGIMTVFGLVTFFFGETLMGLFFKDPNTIGIGVTMLKIFAIGMPFFGAFIMVEQIHGGVGMNTPAMVGNIIHAWALELAPIYYFTQYMSYPVVSVWWVVTCAGVITSIGMYIYYRRGRWLTIKV